MSHVDDAVCATRVNFIDETTMPFHLHRVLDDNDAPTERGTYRRVREYWDEHFGPRGKPNPYWAEVCCPGCGEVGMVGHNHTVAADGTVSPSDVCPYQPCQFHDHIFLDDWAEPSTPRRSGR